MKKRIKKNSKMKRVARWHSVFFLISFGLYVALSAILTPSFMLSDMQTKSKALANETITLVAKVLDSPVVPIVSGSADCIGDNPVVSLTWPTDENSQTFDIARNGATLVTGLLDSSYEDSALPENRTYNTFVVTAHGPMGPGLAVSSPVSITNPAGCSGQFSPTQKILTLETTPIETFTDTPQITSQKPSFSGQTNIPYAKILITLHSGPTITATTYANVNGYWSWICPETLDFGSHTIYTTATDPNDPAITATDTFSFEIIQASSTQENSATHKKRSTTKKTSTPSTPAPTPNQSPATSASAPFSIEVSIKNSENIVYTGSDLSINTNFTNKLPLLADKEFDFIFIAIGDDGQIIFENSEKINPAQINSLTKNLAIPILARAGSYRVIVKTYDGENLISGEAFFQIKELPLLSVGATTFSLTQLMQSLSWLSLIFLMLFFALLGIEYYQSRHAIFQITENYLQRNGFITRRKGVGR